MKSNFNSHDPDAIAATLAQAIRQELGIEAKLGCRIVRNESEHSATRAHVGDYVTYFAGGHPTPLFRARFTIPAPRLVTLQVSVLREGGGAYAGGLIFSAPIAKSIVADVTLGEAKMFADAEFGGDPVVATNLNLNKEITRQATAFASRYAANRLTTRRMVAVLAQGDESLFVASVLPKPDLLGFSFSVTLGAREFCSLANLIEGAL